MNRAVTRTICTVAAIAVSMVLLAIPVAGFDYNESTQGDIQSQKNGKPILFEFDLGDNVIQGSTNFGTPADPLSSDPDEFAFRVPKGTLLHLNSIKYQYLVTSLFGDMRALGVTLAVGEGIRNKKSVAIYNTGLSDGDTFYIFSDGSVPGTNVAPSPVALEFFQILDSQVDLSRPAPPLRPGVYWLTPGAHKHGLSDFGGLWEYVITFTVIAK